MIAEADTAARRRVAYILSPSYSGSTLLTLLLARHPEVATIGELKARPLGDIQQYVCSCREKILECPFWADVRAALRERGHELDLTDFGTSFRATRRGLTDRLLAAAVRGPLFEWVRRTALRTLPGPRQTLQRRLDRNAAVIETVLELQDGRVFLDGSKDVSRLKHLLDADRWDLRVLHLIRDGRASADSYMRHHDVTMSRAALEWVRAQREARRLLDRLDDGVCLTIRYERLCEQSQVVVNDALRFIGCVTDGSPPAERSHHILGNRMRLAPLRAVELDEKWRRRLTDDDLRVFARIAGAMNAELGYE